MSPLRQRPPLYTLALCLPGLVSPIWIKVSVFAVFFSLLGFLTLPKLAPNARRLTLACLALAAVGASVGLFRFASAEALPGMLQARTAAAEQEAVSTLREIANAQDVLRTHAFVDPDGDGIGSAGLLSELSGARPYRSRATRSPTKAQPVLHYRYRNEVRTQHGVAARLGDYLYEVCLPRKTSGWTTDSTADVDDERAERRFVAYSWPFDETSSVTRAFFIDEHIQILEHQNRSRDGSLTYVGSDRAPACSSALDAKTRLGWRPWQGKQPRSNLPGDSSSG